jgi:hypothetical protein
MATFYSDLRTNDRASPPVKNKFAVAGAPTRTVEARFTVPATGIAANDVLELFILKKGERIQPGSKLFWSTGETSQAGKIGDAADDDRYLASTAMTTAGSALIETKFASGAGSFEATADTPILLTITGATPLSGQVIAAHFKVALV